MTGRVHSRRKLHMEEMYEVLSFVEHGTHCRQTMDCVQGMLLIEYLGEYPCIEKQQLFEWFRKIGVCVDQYHRCRNLQNYRCLNPYSIVVTEDKDIRLLDLEAPGNGFVMKQMQKRSMRGHFVKPVYDKKPEGACGADLFAYGKTLQFIMTCAQPVPEFSRREEGRLYRLTERCLGESKRSYEDFRQMLCDLPAAKKYTAIQEKGKLRTIGLAGCAVVSLVICVSLLAGRQGMASGKEEQRTETVKTEATESGEQILGIADEERAQEAAEQIEGYLRAALARNPSETVEIGEEIEIRTVRCLANAYERTGKQREAAQAYGRLMELESLPEEIEWVGVKKMQLEAQNKAYEAAVSTGRAVQERIGYSDKIAELLLQYEELEERAQEIPEEKIPDEGGI